MQPPGLGSDSGIENGRSSCCMGPLEKGVSEIDQQQHGNGGHFLRSSVFRNKLRTIGNEGNSDKIGHFLIIQIVQVPGVTNCIADSLSSLDSSGDYNIGPQLAQILLLWQNLEPNLNLFANQYNAILPRYVSTDPRDSNAQWIGAFNHTWENEIIWIYQPIPMISQILMTLKLQKNYSDCGGTMMARPTLVHNTAI
ncbi:MAG: hypothetical protein EZS28_041783, partial [Streblomastix strix]